MVWPAGPSSAKFRCPVPPAAFVPLARVERALAGSRRVFLVAPAGFGKTCHLAHFSRTVQDRLGMPAAWLSLDPDDADPTILARDVIAAAERAWPGAAGPALPVASATGAIGHVAGQALAAWLERLGPFLLAIDDLHRVSGSDGAAALLTALVEAAGPELRVVMAGQEPPAGLPWARWHLEERVAVLAANALRLRVAEVGRLLAARWELPAAPRVARRVAQATGGWPLLVRLLAERGPEEAGSPAVAAQAGDFGRYVVAELLDRIPRRERRGLLRLALAEQVDAEVGAALLGADAGHLYDRLVARPYFTPVGSRDGAARMQPLLREVLLPEARRRLPAATRRALGQRLAACHAARGDAPRAVAALIAVQDWDGAEALFDRACAMALAAGRADAVRRWLVALPPDRLERSAAVLLVQARLRALDGDHPAAERMALAARRAYAAAGDTAGAAAAAALCALDLDLEATPERIAAAERLAGGSTGVVAGWTRLQLLRLRLAQGAPPTSEALAQSVAAIEGELPLDPWTPRARILADHLRYLAGALDAISCTAAQMVQALGWQLFDYWPALVYAGRWEELAALLDEAGGVPAPAGAEGFVRAWLEVPRAVLAILHGRADDALARLESVERTVLPAPLTSAAWPLELTVLRAVKSTCLSRLGRPEEAERLCRLNLGALGTSATMAPVGHLDLARVLLQRGRFAEAAAELQRASSVAGDPGLRGLYRQMLATALELAHGRADGAAQAGVATVLARAGRLGAYGFVPLYDPGNFADAVARLPILDAPEAEAARRRVLDLFGRAHAAPAAACPAAAPRLVTLGRLEWRPDGCLALPPPRRATEVLVRLLWAGDSGLAREVLAEAVWPEAPPQDQANRLRVTLHGLRRWLAGANLGERTPARVVADRLTVRLDHPEALRWDVDLFRHAADQVRGLGADVDRARRVRAAQAALALYRGPLLPEPVWHDAFAFERRQLELAQVALVEALAASLGIDCPQLPDLLARAVRANPSEEGLQRLWLESLVVQGRRAEAQRAFVECCALRESSVGEPPPASWLRLVGEGGETRRD